MQLFRMMGYLLYTLIHLLELKQVDQLHLVQWVTGMRLKKFANIIIAL